MFSYITGVIVASLLLNSLMQCKKIEKDHLNIESVKKLTSENKPHSPVIVMMELSSHTIHDANGDTGKFPGDIALATFDSSGLQDRLLHIDSSELLRTIGNLWNRSHESGYLPTFHAIHDLVKNNGVGSIVLLITKSRVSDKEFGDILVKSLIGRNIKVSVLWLGERNYSYYGPLYEITQATGGKFELFTVKTKKFERLVTEDNNNEGQNFSASGDVNSFDRIRFPEDWNPGDINSILSSRMGIEKLAGNFYFPVIVDVASGASLEIRPGTPTRIPFTVKNNLNSGMRVIFGAKYQNVPQFLQPDRAFLPPLGTVTVNVNVKPNSNNQLNTNSTLTFSVFLSNKIVSRSAIVSFVPVTTYDKTQPKLNYKFGGDCTEYQDPKNCENGFWGVEITAQDEDSGILKITSEPYGLLFQPEFIAGTKAPVNAYYSTTCCHPKVDIWAEDVLGNYVKKSLDVLDQSLREGEIAAIVLGVLLLVFVIVAIIVAIVLIKRRNRRNMIVPRPRAQSR